MAQKLGQNQKPESGAQQINGRQYQMTDALKLAEQQLLAPGGLSHHGPGKSFASPDGSFGR